MENNDKSSKYDSSFIDKLVNELMIFWDIFSDAVKMAEKDSNPALKIWSEGLIMLQKKYNKLMANVGIKEIPTNVGDNVDLAWNHVVDTIETNELPPDIIMKIISKGFMFEGNVIRPTEVIISISPLPKNC